MVSYVSHGASQVGELIISSLREADEGTYTCVITNFKGSIDHNITVRAENRVVAGRPQIQVLGYFRCIHHRIYVAK